MKEILDQNNWYAKVKKELCKYERTIEGNLKRMKAKSCTNGYLELVEAELKNIDSTVARYSSDNRVSPSGKPALLANT